MTTHFGHIGNMSVISSMSIHRGVSDLLTPPPVDVGMEQTMIRNNNPVFIPNPPIYNPPPSPIPTIVIPNQYVALANHELVVNVGEEILNRIVGHIAQFCADLLSYSSQMNDLVIQITRVLSHKHDLQGVNIYSVKMAEFINNVAYDIVSVLILNKTHTDFVTQSSSFGLVVANNELIIFSKQVTPSNGIF